MSDEKYTKEQLVALGEKLVARRQKQAEAQKRRREKLQQAGWKNVTLQLPEVRIAEIKKLVALLSKSKSGNYYIAMTDENNKAKIVSEQFTMK
ncbi:hypothetical protein GTA51_19975 [Desulfovibrio aerotolerans]|uniref:Uncharacterized protein n=1 Tax=Solidesulfovibrio aerotolerans TaxID=295255 RepID=A0A7C9MNG6_9BACT|nr:hypothetical protein [Solidesulfovibrio aerotolerans]MYL85373.1 hypothetical protein [Solidesulfovibrio aerotolerans]